MTLCTCEGCIRQAVRAGLCSMHVKRGQRGQPLATPALDRPESARERLAKAALTYADAEEDSEYRRAWDNLVKSAAQCGAVDLRQEVDAWRARWEHLGRPRLFAPEVVARLVAEAGGVGKAARQLGISVRTVQRALRFVERSHTHTTKHSVAPP